MAQLVAHHTGSVGVMGSNPISSTPCTKARTLAIIDGIGSGLFAVLVAGEGIGGG